MSWREDLTDAQLDDQRFEESLAKIKPYLMKLQVSNESRLCRLWLERLNNASNQRKLRNDYLLELYKQLKAGELMGPFNKPPPNTDRQLIPIAKSHRLVTSSSCNELTETSLQSHAAEQRRVWHKPRSKSLRRDNPHRSRNPVNGCNVHSNSSPNATPRTDRTEIYAPIVHFCEQESRADRNWLKKYKERIETLNAIVQDLETQNEKLKEKLTYYHNASLSSEVPHLRARIKQLKAEIEILKEKLSDVQKIKITLQKHHQKNVEMYKSKMEEQYYKFKRQLEIARKKNQGLNSNIVLLEQKLRQLNSDGKDSATINNEELEKRLEYLKMDYDERLKYKEEELKIKDELVLRKDNELSEKGEEIDCLNEKVKNLKQTMELKYQEEERWKAQFWDQCKSAIKDQILKVRKEFETNSLQQRQIQREEMLTLKRHVQKLEKLAQCQQQEYGKKIYHSVKEGSNEINSLEPGLGNKFNSNSSKYSLNHSEFEDYSESFKCLYHRLLNCIAKLASDRRTRYYKDLLAIENKINQLRLQD